MEKDTVCAWVLVRGTGGTGKATTGNILWYFLNPKDSLFLISDILHFFPILTTTSNLSHKLPKSREKSFIFVLNKCIQHSTLLLFSCYVMSDSLWPHELQHSRFPCPLLSPKVCSNSCPLSWWRHPTILSFVVPFFSCVQSFPALGSFPISWLFTADDQNIGASASAAVLPMNIHEFPLGLTGLIPLLSEGLSRVFSKIMVQKHQFLALSLHVHVQIFTSICDYWENHSFD